MTKAVFGDLILQNRESLYRVARSILQNDEDCMDAISEAITKAFEKLNTLKKDEFAKTWLIRILINECYAICRQNKWMYIDEILDEFSLLIIRRNHDDIENILDSDSYLKERKEKFYES